jgi:hypothetical protein
MEMTMEMLHLRLRSRRLAVAAGALVLFGVTLAGCAAVTTGSYLNTQVEFRPHVTFGWGAADQTPTGDPRLDNNPFFNDRVRAEVERGLTRRGYVLVPSGTPDLTVHVHTSMNQEIDAQQIDRQFCADGGCRPSVYDAGTLVVDLVDTATSRLLWRGWADSALGELINSQPAMEQRIDESVTRILERLPSRL